VRHDLAPSTKALRAALALALLSACRAGAPAPGSPAPAPAVFRDGLVDAGGLSLHAHCVGAGEPAVVFDSGLGLDGDAWRDVQAEVGRVTRACAYDRAGLGYSDPAPRPHGNRRMARELSRLLERAGVRGPYVLVGHSMGGVNLRLLASEHPDAVAGMVLVDAMGDEQPSRYWALLPEADRAGFRAGLATLPEGVDFDTLAEGLADMRASSRSLGDKPLVVLTRGKDDPPPGLSPERATEMARAWREMQVALAGLSTDATHVVAKNGHHNLMWDAPKLVVASVREVVAAARARRRVNQRALASFADEGPPGGAP
jgi:pimeloyl-ACP methyl ester carboxylesterase